MNASPRLISNYYGAVDRGSRIMFLRGMAEYINDWNDAWGSATPKILMPDQCMAGTRLTDLAPFFNRIIACVNGMNAEFAMGVTPTPLALNLDYTNFTPIVFAITAQMKAMEAVRPGGPVCVVDPVITGGTFPGQVVNVSNGTWEGSPTSFAYQWYNATNAIAGATSSTYTIASADAGGYLVCHVTATNAKGSTVAQSGQWFISAAPTNTVAPSIFIASGDGTVGSSYACNAGTWVPSGATISRQWLRNGANIAGATATSYTAVAADSGTALSCRVTATNAGGSNSAVSNSMNVP